MDDLNKSNLDREIITDKAWSAYSKAYFGKKEPLEELWVSFQKQKVKLPDNLTIADFGGAEGIVGEFFKEKLSKNHKVTLYLIDVLDKLLQKNKNKDIIKISEDLRDFSKNEYFDLIIMRSVLHYFSLQDQLKVLRNAHESLKKEGHLLIQAFVQDPEDLELFYKLNKFVDRKLQLSPIDQLAQSFKQVGFSQIKNLGSLSTWHLQSKDFQQRYELSDSQLNQLKEKIEQTPLRKRKGFTIDSNGFTIPVPYVVFLLKK